jgi:hypothetical protein
VGIDVSVGLNHWPIVLIVLRQPKKMKRREEKRREEKRKQPFL